MSTLVIVESPNKIAKISQCLGSGYTVISCVGHFRDLPANELGIDIESDFKPTYIEQTTKKDVIAKMRSEAKKAKKILIATDMDREGEGIAFHISETLKLKDPERLVFTSISKDALQAALKKMRKLDNNLVKAQETRRLLDRLAGYLISPVLNNQLGGSKLSAGRVQSVVLRLVVEKEREIAEKLKSLESKFKIKGQLLLPSSKLKFQSALGTFSSKKWSELCVEKSDIEKWKAFLGSPTLKLLVDEIEQKEVQVKPQPPFSTSTLQRDAKSKLHMSVKQTAAISQSLFAKGKITYIRTDSTELSPECFEAVKAYIYREYGESYYNGQQYKTKIVNAQEAHEAIRPTYITEPELDDTFSNDEKKLYRLIWARTIASQMKNGIDDVVNMFTKMMDDSSDKTSKELAKYRFKTLFKKVKYDGFRVIYGVNEEDNEDDMEAQTLTVVPPKGSEVDYAQLTLYENFSGVPYRYDDARLVQEFEKRGIGRPSTSANMVTYIQEKGYVEVKNVEGVEKDALTINVMKKKGGAPELVESTTKVMIGNENKKLVPTSTGTMIVEFLEDKFKFIMDYNFTKDMEAELDEISNGTSTSLSALRKFYDNLAPIVSELQSGGRKRYAKNERYLGEIPSVETETTNTTDTPYKLTACIGKYGPCVMKYIEKDGKQENVEFASINEPLTVETITLEEAIKLFGFPRKVGTINRKHVTIGRSKYGFYAKVGTEYTQLDEITDANMDEYKEKTDSELLTVVKNAITAKTAKKEEQQKEANKKVLKKVMIDKKEYSVNVGQYGLYFYTKPEKKGEKPQFFSIPKEYTNENIDTLTVDKMKEIMAAPPKPRYAKKDDGTTTAASKRVTTRTYRRPKKEQDADDE